MNCSLPEALVSVVEDDPQMRNSFAAIISSLGYPVRAYASGEEFLKHVDPHEPGCALVDFRLPGMTGIEVQRRLSSVRHDFPVILISAFLDVSVAAEALQQGVFRILQKPYSNDELADALQTAIHNEQTLGRKRRLRLDVEHRLDQLDARERSTLDLILEGQPNKSIGRRMGLSRRTIERIRSRILEKMGSASFVELAANLGMTECAEAEQGSDDAAPALSDSKWQRLRCDVHDGATQYVSAAAMRLQSLQNRTDIPIDAQHTLGEALRLLTKTQEDLRDLVADRTPAQVREAGLVAAIRSLIMDLSSHDAVQIELIQGLGPEPLSPEVEIAIYRIAQEALNNALRHSGSRRVRVELAQRYPHVLLQVSDEGRGFNPASSLSTHFGLRCMRQRAESLGGTFTLDSQPGIGTRVAVRLPA